MVQLRIGFAFKSEFRFLPTTATVDWSDLHFVCVFKELHTLSLTLFKIIAKAMYTTCRNGSSVWPENAHKGCFEIQLKTSCIFLS